MKRLFIYCFVFFIACHASEDQFHQFAARYQQAIWKQFPDWASSIGQHQYHSALVIPSTQKRQADLQFCQQYLDSLAQFDPAKWPESVQSQYASIQEQLLGFQQQIKKDRAYQEDPSFYNVRGSFLHVLHSTDLSLEDRLQLLSVKMQQIPAYYAAARNNLKKPNLENSQKAIAEHELTFDLFFTVLPDSLLQSTLPLPEQEQFQQGLIQSQNAIKAYIAFCNSLTFEFGELET